MMLNTTTVCKVLLNHTTYPADHEVQESETGDAQYYQDEVVVWGDIRQGFGHLEHLVAKVLTLPSGEYTVEQLQEHLTDEQLQELITLSSDIYGLERFFVEIGEYWDEDKEQYNINGKTYTA